MENIKKDLEKKYKIYNLKSEICLWQIHIIEHPNDKECYQNAIADNLNKLKKLEG